MKPVQVKKTFKIVGIKGHGAFADFATEVPDFARQLLLRTREIENHTNVEIALFEPKRDENHLEGDYYVGIVVHDKPRHIPKSMEYMEVSHTYTSIRGPIAAIDSLYKELGDWTEAEGDSRHFTSYIIETYHPTDRGEEVEIYLPIK
jgi:predicted transcriptional regulator YdeE